MGTSEVDLPTFQHPWNLVVDCVTHSGVTSVARSGIIEHNDRCWGCYGRPWSADIWRIRRE